MTNEQLPDNHPAEAPDEIETLLPWYVEGTLGAETVARVEAYLAAHPEMQRALALIAEERHETIAANECLSVPSAAARDRLMAALAAEEAASAPAPAAALALSLWQRMKAAWVAILPEGVSPVGAFSGLAAAAVIAVQSVVLAILIAGGSPSSGGGTRLASGPEADVITGADFWVRFAKDATASDITAHLKPLGAVIVDGPKPGGLFRLRILNPADNKALMNKLRARRDIVVFVAPAK
ncbi:MAG: hypothetical protein P8Y36_12570 [Alphaproteobacteria bacterium]